MRSIEGNIVRNGIIERARVEIDDAGMITKVAAPTGAADLVLGTQLVFPGFIDIHVHAREDVTHSQDYKEDFATAGAAALHGGVTAFADMPNTPTPPVDDATYAARLALTQKCPVDVVLYAGIGPTTNPLSKKVPYKAFMGHSVGGLFFSSREELETTIARYSGQHVSFHAEDPKIMHDHEGEATHGTRRPAEAEITAVDFAIGLIEKYNLHGKICHVSTREAAEKIRAAKSRGIDVIAEVAPHHLYFDETMFPEGAPVSLQVNPPIRQSRENRLALIAALRDGTLDCLATDHAPHTLEEKEKGISGMPHLDTYGSFTTWLMKEHGFSPGDIARVAAESPGRFLSQFLPEKHGKIEEGYAGSLTVIDPDNSLAIIRQDQKTKCGWSPFEGIAFPGQVTHTIIKGNIYES